MNRRQSTYQIIEAIGHGGMANVYRARDTDLEREVAIKELSEELSEKERFVHLFLSEARKMASISHPNVLPIFSIDDPGEQPPRLIMELAEISLGDQFDGQPQEPLRVERVGRQILLGLEAIHGEQLVHRDIKPGNILYGRGFYKIADFGIATDGEAQTQLLATPKFMAPEVLHRPHLVGAPSDLYSLGLVLYEALVGTDRFEAAAMQVVDDEVAAGDGIRSQQGSDSSDDGEAGSAIHRKQLWRSFHGGPGELPPSHELDAGIPEALSIWISRLVRKEISERFQSAREALAALDPGRGETRGTMSYGPESTQRIDRSSGDAGKGTRRWILGLCLGVFLTAASLLFGYQRQWITVDVSSQPAGAVVEVEGEVRGRTPWQSSLKVGSSVSLLSPGFETLDLVVEGRSSRTLDGVLVWKPVQLRSRPKGASVIVDGKELGKTPLNFIGQGAGTEVVLELAGFESEVLRLEPGQATSEILLSRSWPELPGTIPLTAPSQLIEQLLAFVSEESESSLVLAGGSGAVFFHQSLQLVAEVSETRHAVVFLLFSNGDGAVIYPSPRGGALRLEANRATTLPLARHREQGFRLEADEPAGKDVAFLLTSPRPLQGFPEGDPLASWMTSFPFHQGDTESPALALVRWVAEQRQSGQNVELVMSEIQVVDE